MIGSTNLFARRVLAGAVALSATSVLFAGSPSAEFIRIEATNGAGTAVFSVPSAAVPFNAATQQWEWSSGLVTLMDGGTPVANLNSASLTIGASFNVLALNFNVDSGLTDTFFTITTGTLSFPTVFQPLGGVSGGLNVVDQDPEFGGGVLMMGQLADGANADKAFRADYNGAVPTGTTLFTGVESVANDPGELSGSSGAFGTPNGGAGGLAPLGVPVSDMSMQLGFSLSAADNATGTATYGIIPVPEPATLALLMLGAVMSFPRRR